MGQTLRSQNGIEIDEGLLQEARELELDLSRAAADGIARAIKAEKERRWKIENAEAIRASNDYVAKHGLPLAKYRTF
ncbi:type II toxin-antitoxin system CcdA family antitoxin [Rhizobium sp. AAP43]|uniref:type II toxin-antitoxin system CcdA family antitoxin n=1 Tax=Rhizobium sp. AAP43 TaxID=1523420 RepID=UPI0006B94A47|nr:type II toxin-antitoxin system CcdA family antitoxin [Rhizobium sp. AAP43]KPF47448.1 post-segregation antitoxin CcdA [Rhizobium sp. AAP43]